MANPRLKPFLTVSQLSKDSVTIGVTDRYRVQCPLSSEMHDEEPYPESLVTRLQELGLTVEDYDLWPDEDSRTLSYMALYSSLPVMDLAKIRGKPVVIIGCGGLGSRLALDLAALRVSDFTLIDTDVIDASNLPRMFFFTKNEIGKPKVKALKEQILRIHEEASVQAVQECAISWMDRNGKAIPEDAFVFLTADGEDGAFLSNLPDSMREAKASIMIAGYWESSAIIGPIFSGQTLSPKDFFLSTSRRTRRVRDFVPPSIGGLNSLISGIMQIEYFKFISGNSILSDHQMVLELHAMRLTKTRVGR